MQITFRSDEKQCSTEQMKNFYKKHFAQKKLKHILFAQEEFILNTF